MIEVIRADGLMDRLRFFGSGERFARGECGLVVRRGGRVCARAIAGETRRADAGYVRALFLCRDQDAANALTGAIREEMRARGRRYALGPLDRGLSGFGNGLRVEGFSGPDTPFEANNPAWTPEMLAKCGWKKEEDLLVYRLTRDRYPRAYYRRAAACARDRFGIEGRSIEGMSRREVYERLCALYRGIEPTDEEALARQIDRLFPKMGDTVLAMRSGECVGALVALREGTSVRAACLHVAVRARNQGATAVLFDALDKRLPPEIGEIQAGTVVEENECSKRNIEHTGATFFRKFRVYRLDN